MSRSISEPEWLLFEPLIDSIQSLKKQRNALILAHHYQSPEIYYGVADFQGDSLQLARHAAESDAAVIVMCGVQFMAETAKLLCPRKDVLLPASEAGCSLAAAIGPQDVRALRQKYPGSPVVLEAGLADRARKAVVRMLELYPRRPPERSLAG